MKNVLSKILKTALFTRRCQLCGEIVAFDEDLCPRCKCLKMIEAPLCNKCGSSKKHCRCKDNKKHHQIEYKAVIAPYYYMDSVQQGVLNFKMHEMPFLAKMQGKEISKAVKLHYNDIDFDFVTYVPMRFRDEQRRGFNQSKLLAEIVSKECNIPLEDVLVKAKKTKKQKRQNAEDRFINVYNAFKVKSGFDVSDATVLLIDDVKTTGATLNSCALTLKANGAKAVYCAAFALIKI